MLLCLFVHLVFSMSCVPHFAQIACFVFVATPTTYHNEGVLVQRLIIMLSCNIWKVGYLCHSLLGSGFIDLVFIQIRA